MKKILTVAALLLVVILSLTACYGFNGFGKDTECEVHIPDEPVVKNFVVATCYSEGSFDSVVYCTVCDTELSRTTVTLDKDSHTIAIDSAVEATCIATGLTEGKHCSVCNEIIVEQNVTNKISHSYEGRRCTVCGDINYSEGLDFELNSDGASYTVTGFGSCRDRDTIIPSTYNGCPVTAIGEDAFSGCRSLTSVTIPDSVTTIGASAFYACDSLRSVTIPDRVTTIGDEAFFWCLSLTSVTIPDSVTTIGGGAFYNCTRLKSIKVSENNTTYKSIDGNLYTKDGKTLVQYAIGKSDTSFTIPDIVTTIGYAAFYYCTSLTSVTIPDSVTTIGNSAFSWCDSLTSVTIPDSVTTIGDHAFAYCSSLTSVTIGNSVTTIGELAFYNCKSLTSVIFKDTTTWYRTSNYDDFINMTGGGFISVEDPSDNAEYLKDYYYHRYYWYKK